jgi:hypothetical protein
VSKLLARLLKDRDSGTYFFNAIRKQRLKAEEEKKDNYAWDGKIHPSAMHFDMCLEEYFAAVDTYQCWEIDNIYKAAAGTAKHQELQAEAIKAIGLLWEKPNMPPDMVEKLEALWPEIPVRLTEVRDPDSGDVVPIELSGRIDVVINLKGSPVPIDIKTTSVLPDKKPDEKADSYTKATLKTWTDKMDKAQEYLTGKFEDIPKTIQTIAYRKYFTQLCIYAYTLNIMGLYPVRIDKFGFAYLNLMMPPGDKGSEREIYVDFPEELERMTGRFLLQGAYHRLAKLGGITRPCSNTLCEKHGKFLSTKS